MVETKKFVDNTFMNVYFENDILYLVWKENTSQLSDNLFKEQAIQFINAVKETISKKIIVDMRKFQYSLSEELIAWRNQNVIPTYNEIKVEKFAFISETPTVKQDNPNNSFITHTFTNIEEALKWLE